MRYWASLTGSSLISRAATLAREAVPHCPRSLGTTLTGDGHGSLAFICPITYGRLRLGRGLLERVRGEVTRVCESWQAAGEDSTPGLLPTSRRGHRGGPILFEGEASLYEKIRRIVKDCGPLTQRPKVTSTVSTT